MHRRAARAQQLEDVAVPEALPVGHVLGRPAAEDRVEGAVGLRHALHRAGVEDVHLLAPVAVRRPAAAAVGDVGDDVVQSGRSTCGRPSIGRAPPPTSQTRTAPASSTLRTSPQRSLSAARARL